MASCNVLWEFLTEAKTSVFVVMRRIIIITGSLHDPVTWYKITYAREQVAQWDLRNKGRSRWTGTSCIVLEVRLRNLLTILTLLPINLQRMELRDTFRSTKISGNSGSKSNGTESFRKIVSKISVHLSRLSFFLEIWKFRKFPVPFGISTPCVEWKFSSTWLFPLAMCHIPVLSFVVLKILNRSKF